MEKEVKEKRMTKEEEIELLGLLPFDDEAVDKSVPERFLKLPKSDRPVLHIRSLTAKEKRQIERLQRKLNEELMRKIKNEDIASDDDIEDELRECGRKMLVGWDNMKTATRKKLEFRPDPEGGCSKDLWDKLPVWLMVWVINRGLLISGLKEPELKSLGS